MFKYQHKLEIQLETGKISIEIDIIYWPTRLAGAGVCGYVGNVRKNKKIKKIHPQMHLEGLQVMSSYVNRLSIVNQLKMLL